MPRAGYPLKKKLAAVQEYLATGLMTTTASKHGTTKTSLKRWVEEYNAGELKEPGAVLPGKEESPVPLPGKQLNGKRARRIFTDEFKADIVEQFLQRPPGTQFKTFCRERDLGEGQVRDWIEKHRGGQLVARPQPDRSEIARAPRPNGHAHVTAQLSMTMSDEPPPAPLGQLPPQVAFYIQRLENQNKALRKMVQIAMEAI